MTFGQRLKRARRAAGLSQDAVAAMFKIARASVAQWESGDTQPQLDKLAILCEALGTTPDYLLLGEPHTSALLTGDGTASMAIAEDRGPRVPVVGTVQAGDRGYFEELQYPVGHGDGFIPHYSRDPTAYAVRVRGDSMRPRILPGEYIVAEPTRAPRPGDEVLVRTTDGRSMVKRFAWRRDGNVELLSINDAHAPMQIADSDIERMHYVAAIVKDAYYPHDP